MGRFLYYLFPNFKEPTEGRRDTHSGRESLWQGCIKLEWRNFTLNACNLHFNCKESFALFSHEYKSHNVEKPHRSCVLMVSNFFYCLLIWYFDLILILLATLLAISSSKSYCLPSVRRKVPIATINITKPSSWQCTMVKSFIINSASEQSSSSEPHPINLASSKLIIFDRIPTWQHPLQLKS